MLALKRLTLINPIHFLSTIIVFSILRMAMPFTNYIFIPLLSFFFIFTLYQFIQSNRTKTVINFIKNNKYLLIISFLFIWALANSDTCSTFSIKEILTAIFIVFLSFSLFVFVDNRNKFQIFTQILIKQIILSSTIVGLLGLIKFYLQLRAYQSLFSNVLGTSLVRDNNFYVLFIFAGIISILFSLSSSNYNINLIKNKILTFSLFILSTNVLFSFSRRGFVLLGLTLIITVIILFYNFKKENGITKILAIYLFSFLFLNLIIVTFLLSSIQTKKNSLNHIGISSTSYRNVSSILLYKYSTIFSDKNYSFYKKMIWNEKPNPQDPNSGWALRICSFVTPLTGELVEIVPKNTIGYKMDSTCNASTWGGNAFSYTCINDLFQGHLINSKETSYIASVYCYVSKDFNGTWARVSVEGNVSGKTIQNYNLSRKGTWQKLQIRFKANSKLAPVYLYWAKYGVTDFKTLQGHIVFAYPEYSVSSKKNKVTSTDPSSGWASRISYPVISLTGEFVEMVPKNTIGYKMDSTCNASTWGGNAFSYTSITDLFHSDSIISDNSTYTASVYCYVSNEFDGTWARISAEGNATGKTIQNYDLSKKGTWQKLQITFKSKSGLPPVYLYWAKYGVTDFKTLQGYIIFAYPQYSPYLSKLNPELSTLVQKSDQFQLMESNFIITQIPRLNISKLKSFFKTDTLVQLDTSNFFNALNSDALYGTRASRLQYSWTVYKKYSTFQKFFGGGFAYLEMFGSKFKAREFDYPHNPVISAFLYSGIMGGVAYMGFLFLVFYYYLKYYKFHLYFLLMFLTVFFFSFFSGNSHFSIPIYAFLCIIPFLTRYIVEKEKSEIESIT